MEGGSALSQLVHLDTDVEVGKRFRNAWASSTLSAAIDGAAGLLKSGSGAETAG